MDIDPPFENCSPLPLPAPSPSFGLFPQDPLLSSFSAEAKAAFFGEEEDRRPLEEIIRELVVEHFSDSVYRGNLWHLVKQSSSQSIASCSNPDQISELFIPLFHDFIFEIIKTTPDEQSLEAAADLRRAFSHFSRIEKAEEEGGRMAKHLAQVNRNRLLVAGTFTLDIVKMLIKSYQFFFAVGGGRGVSWFKRLVAPDVVEFLRNRDDTLPAVVREISKLSDPSPRLLASCIPEGAQDAIEGRPIGPSESVAVSCSHFDWEPEPKGRRGGGEEEWEEEENVTVNISGQFLLVPPVYKAGKRQRNTINDPTFMRPSEDFSKPLSLPSSDKIIGLLTSSLFGGRGPDAFLEVYAKLLSARLLAPLKYVEEGGKEGEGGLPRIISKFAAEEVRKFEMLKDKLQLAPDEPITSESAESLPPPQVISTTVMLNDLKGAILRPDAGFLPRSYRFWAPPTVERGKILENLPEDLQRRLRREAENFARAYPNRELNWAPEAGGCLYVSVDSRESRLTVLCSPLQLAILQCFVSGVPLSLSDLSEKLELPLLLLNSEKGVLFWVGHEVLMREVRRGGSSNPTYRLAT